MTNGTISTATGAQAAAFALAFTNSRSPLPFETHTDAELVEVIRARVPSAPMAECREALARVRHLCDAVYKVCEAFRKGAFGTGPESAPAALAALAQSLPGFSDQEYREAFATGLLWTAF